MKICADFWIPKSFCSVSHVLGARRSSLAFNKISITSINWIWNYGLGCPSYDAGSKQRHRLFALFFLPGKNSIKSSDHVQCQQNGSLASQRVQFVWNVPTVLSLMAPFFLQLISNPKLLLSDTTQRVPKKKKSYSLQQKNWCVRKGEHFGWSTWASIQITF